MAQVMEGLYYSREHEWVKLAGEHAIVGITDYAQAALGDVVYLDFAKANCEVHQHECVATIESVKAVSDLYVPLSGLIIRANPIIQSDPAIVNRDPYGAGWLFEMKPKALEELSHLMDAQAYREYLTSLV